MCKKKILCRADGDASTGLGHLYRMIAIAGFYKDYYDILFLSKSDDLKSILPDGYHFHKIPSEIVLEEEPVWLSENFDSDEYVIFVDGYQFVSSYQKQIKERGFFLLYIDDLTTEFMYADVVVNHSPSCVLSDFRFSKQTQFALGTKYAMLRSSFNAQASIPRDIDGIKNVFVCFGGADQYDLSLSAVKALLSFETVKEIHVVLGQAYNHKELYEITNRSNKVFLYKNVFEEQLMQIMLSCQLAIAPSSTILYELCSVKMPIVSGYYVENQKPVYAGFLNEGLIIGAGDLTNFTIENYKDLLSEVLPKSDFSYYLRNQAASFDGGNKRRFLSLINSSNVSFRRATSDDLMTVFHLSNDKLVRKNSYSSDPIELEDHRSWFSRKINSDSTLFLMAMINEKVAGVVRYEVNDNHAVVGVLVANEFRGQRLATPFLIKSADLFFGMYKKPILAYIKEDNIASKRAFENAGYELLRMEKYCDQNSFVFKLERNDF